MWIPGSQLFAARHRRTRGRGRRRMGEAKGPRLGAAALLQGVSFAPPRPEESVVQVAGIPARELLIDQPAPDDIGEQDAICEARAVARLDQPVALVARQPISLRHAIV